MELIYPIVRKASNVDVNIDARLRETVTKLLVFAVNYLNHQN